MLSLLLLYTPIITYEIIPITNYLMCTSYI